MFNIQDSEARALSQTIPAMQAYPILSSTINKQPYPLLFATLSGAHLYGFPSPDSDYDVRGVHILPLSDMIGLMRGPETIEVSNQDQGFELDLVTHEVQKFFELLLKRNGYVLEQLYSPLIVHTTSEHEALKQIARGCMTRYHSHHYLGFAKTQWRLLEKETPPRVKPLLYVYRVLLTGIHLMQTGEIEANLVTLNQKFQLAYIPELIDRKLTGAEQSNLAAADLSFYAQEYSRLVQDLEMASQNSTLTAEPTAKADLHDLLVQIRLASSINHPGSP
jgi:uncharacterized protein